ncbi:MAG: hypothetical protein WC162_10020 [Sphaerochaetaceae bacterium]|nr:hypothetical protein [Sphaerochaetaceae bacterium]
MKHKFFSKETKEKIKGFWQGLEIANRDKATAQIDYEVKEMQDQFSLMLFGDAIGLPSPPVSVTMELLPLMTKDFDRMVLRASETENGFAEIASIIGEP